MDDPARYYKRAIECGAKELSALLLRNWRHEAGGFIVMDSAGNLEIVRWPKGEQSSILLPPHLNCRIDHKDIIATFHTHPNTGEDYIQEPSETDKRAVRDDPDLKGKFYEGEIVISKEKIYLIAPDGQVSQVDNAWEILSEAKRR